MSILHQKYTKSPPVLASILSVAVLAIFACTTAAIDWSDGEYLVVADRYADDGWTPYLRLVVQGGQLSDIEFDYRNRFGDVLSHQEYLNNESDLHVLNGNGNLPSSVSNPHEALNYLSDAAFSVGRARVEENYSGRIVYDLLALEEALREAEEAGELGDGLEPVQAALPGDGERIAVSEHPAVAHALDGVALRRAARRGGVNTDAEVRGAEALVSSHYLATEAAAETLNAGGTAADAAFVMAAVLSMTEPWFSSILGGGTWALYYDAEAEEVRSLDGVAPVASGATPELFADVEFRDRSGMHMANVPGAWSGWIDWLSEYGELPLDELLEPAVRLGREGFPASEGLINWLNIGENVVRAFPDTAEIYLRDGELPSVGDTIYQENMAATFEELSEVYLDNRASGERAALEAARDHFYRGPIAERIVAFSDANDGLYGLEDFTEFRDSGFTDPISVTYRGLDVYQNPPNSQGISMLLALNILEGFDLASYGHNSAEAVHLQVEALKLALADRNRHVGDPDFVDVPVEQLLSEEHAARQRERISMSAALEWPFDGVLAWNPNESNTTTFHVIDRYGNAAAVTTSLGAQFLVVGDTGIHINNRMRMMHHDASDPNAIEPGKKVRHTSNPYMVLREGRPYILGGNTGADFQPQGQLQQLVRLVDYEMSAQESIAQPRFVSTGVPNTVQPFVAAGGLGVEPEFSQDIRDALAAVGHNVSEGGTFGSANAIRIIDHASGEIQLGAEPREEVSSGELRRP